MDSMFFVASGIAAIPGILAAIISGLVLRNQKLQDERYQALKNHVQRHDDDIREIGQLLRDKDSDIAIRYVNTEVFLRETGFARRTLEHLTSAVSNLDGKLTVVDKLPQICGDISRAIVREMKNKTETEQ